MEIIVTYCPIKPDTLTAGNRNGFGIKLFLLGNVNCGFESCFLMLHHLIQSVLLIKLKVLWKGNSHVKSLFWIHCVLFLRHFCRNQLEM